MIPALRSANGHRFGAPRVTHGTDQGVQQQGYQRPAPIITRLTAHPYNHQPTAGTNGGPSRSKCLGEGKVMEHGNERDQVVRANWHTVEWCLKHSGACYVGVEDLDGPFCHNGVGKRARFWP